MPQRHLTPLLLGLAILVVAIVMNPGVGIALGGLLLVILLVILLGRCRVAVGPHEAMIIGSGLDGAVLRVVPGPNSTFLVPFLQKAGPVLNTADQRVAVHVESILQRGPEPIPFTFEANVIYRLAPQTVSLQLLGEVLPDLTVNTTGLIRFWTDCYLRKFVADVDIMRRPSAKFNRFESRLERMLRDRFARSAIEIGDVQLLVQSPAGLHDQLGLSEQQKIITASEVERLHAFLQALAGQSEEARRFAELEWARNLGQAGQTCVVFDLACRLPTP